MTGYIEKLARAVVIGETKRAPTEGARLENIVRAILKAMREPASEMLMGAHHMNRALDPQKHRLPLSPGFEAHDATLVWQAMIDAALEPKVPTGA